MEKQEIAKTAYKTPNEMISQALVQGGVDLEKLEKLLNLQKDYEANEARKAYALDFAEAQAKIEAVVKTKLNPQTHSKYADLSDIIKSAQPIYTASGFSMIFYEGDTTKPEHIRVCADVLHKSGHKETYHFDVPLDGVGIKGNANMTKIHGKSSSVSYGRRYLTCMVWNIPTQDDDGQAAAAKPVEFITPEQANEINSRINALGKAFLVDKFLACLKTVETNTILSTDYNKAIKILEQAELAKSRKGKK